MLGVFANDHDSALALDDLALLAHGLDRRSDFHIVNLLLMPEWPLVGASSISLASGFAESSLIPLRLLYNREPLRWGRGWAAAFAAVPAGDGDSRSLSEARPLEGKACSKLGR